MNRPFSSKLRIRRTEDAHTHSSDEFEEIIRLNSSLGQARRDKHVNFAVDSAVENDSTTFTETTLRPDSHLQFYPELRDALYKRIAAKENYRISNERSGTPQSEVERAIEQQYFLERKRMASASHFAKGNGSFVKRDSATSSSEVPTGKKENQEVDETPRFFPELQELVDKRFVEARMDLIENKLDRETMSRQDKTEAQSLLFKLMLAKIDELERQLQTRSAPVRQPGRTQKPAPKSTEAGLYLYSSNFVMDKATQTPSKNHDSEGVYVMVSRKTGAKAKKSQRKFSYGYPEYVTREQEASRFLGKKIVTQSIMFLPPIPDPMSKRRPRDVQKPGKHNI